MTDRAHWPALVLTAGLATRLQPLSSVRAKAALPVAGEPLIGRILRWLRDAGITRVVLNLHHRAETITREVGDGARWGLDVGYSWESTALGSAGGPARALPLLAADRFLVVNGDTLTTLDLAGLMSQHVSTESLVTMAVVPGDTARYGGVVANGDGVIRGFARAGGHGVPSSWHFIGVQAVNAAAFAGVGADHPSETVRTLYPALIAARPGSVRVYSSEAEFLDIGTPGDYLETAIRIAAREGKPLDRGHGCTIAPDAHLARTILWDNVVIGPRASLTDCIVTDGVTVPAGGRYHRSSLVLSSHGMIVVPF